MSHFKKEKKVQMVKITMLITLIVLIISIAGYFTLQNPKINPVDSDEFTCIEHGKDSDRKYTISYRGKTFLVSKDETSFYNIKNGDAVSNEDSDYHQIKRCIRMYEFYKAGYTGRSPAELINGEYRVNKIETVEKHVDENIAEVDSLSIDSSTSE